jgi:anti-anti-sigma factor
MQFDVIALDGATNRVVMRGRLDAAGAEQIDLRFTAAVASAGQNALLDLREVDFIASLGLRMIISAARVLQRRERHMVIFGAQPQVQEVLDTVALDELIPVVATEQEAQAKLAA